MMKYYILFFFIFCLLIGGGIYTLNPSPITISFFSYNLSFPLSLWIIGSVTIFFTISLFFFANHWIGKFLTTYRQEKDFNRLINQICDQILQKQVTHPSYRTEIFQSLSRILQRITFEPHFESSPSKNPQIDQLLLDLKSLDEGKVIKASLPSDTPLWVKNIQNKIANDSKFAQKVIEENYSISLKQYAIFKLIENDGLNEKLIQKIIQQDFSQQNAKDILHHFLNKGYKLGQAELMALLVKFDSKALIAFFNQNKHFFDPDFCVELFGKLAQETDQAKNAYVYVLIDFSMFDKTKEFLIEHEELILARAYIELKEIGKNYPFDEFFI